MLQNDVINEKITWGCQYIHDFSSASSNRELLFLAIALEDTIADDGEEDECWLLFSGDEGEPVRPCVGGNGGFDLGQPYCGYNCGTHPALVGQSGISPLPPVASHLPATECWGMNGGLCEVAR